MNMNCGKKAFRIAVSRGSARRRVCGYGLMFPGNLDYPIPGDVFHSRRSVINLFNKNFYPMLWPLTLYGHEK